MATDNLVPRSAALREAREKAKHGKSALTATLSVVEACKQLGIGRSTLYRLIRENKIKSIKIGRRRLISLKAIERFIEQNESSEAEA